MHLNNKLMISKSKGILTTLPKIATGTCSRRLAVRGPARPAGLGAGGARGCPGSGTAGSDGWHTRCPGWGQCRRRSGRCSRAGGRCQQRQRDAGLGSSPYPRGGDAGPAATAPGATLSQGRVSAGGCSYGLPLPCSTVGMVQVMARADGERLWGGSRALATALAGVGGPGPGCVRVPQPGWVQECRGTCPGTQTTKLSP